jgi:8-oxo-dGTP diphosphatase
MRRVLCAGAVVTDAAGRLLLIQRGHEPEAGLWSLPGGRLEPGETAEQAMIREVREETGLTVQPVRLLGEVEQPGLAGAVVVISDYLAEVTGGRLAAGDDAADVRWVAPPELARLLQTGELALTSGLAQALAAWGVLG